MCAKSKQGLVSLRSLYVEAEFIDKMPDSFPQKLRARAVLALIGETPMVPLFFEPEGITIYAKCEFLNPSGSVKDRLAKSVLLDAEQRRELRTDSIILECSSGNTGIAL